MRWRAFFIISAFLNLLLIAAWIQARKSPPPSAGDEAVEPARPRTQVVVRRQFFSWSELESTDYPTYIANLRSVDCPEPTIRDIIIADVTALFARKRAALIQSSEEQWWRATPDSASFGEIARNLRALESERKALLTNLLGPDWEPKDAALAQLRRPVLSLDGPVLGQLSEEKKRELITIITQSQRQMEELEAAAAAEGRRPTSREIAAIRQASRTQMQKLLTASQLDEFLLRYSQTAIDLRSQLGSLRHFNATPDEFRALFHACDPIDVKLFELSDSKSASDTKLRETLQKQRESAIKLALGAKRYELYRQLQDSGYRDAYGQALSGGLPGAAGAIQEINLATRDELARLRGATNLTAEQTAIAAKRLELEQLKATAEALGQPVPPDPNAPPPLPTEEPKPKPRIHLYRNGETIGALATQYGVPVAAILDANPGIQVNVPRPGQRIVIPPAPKRVQ